MIKYFSFLSFFLFQVTLIAQNTSLALSEIDPILFKDANSVVRLDQHIVNITDRRTMEVAEKRVVTVLNKNGDNLVNAYTYYDEVTRVKNLQATVYDKNGNELKDFKKRDFNDVAAVDGISLFTDSRVLYLNYTPTSYPYTVVFEVTTVTKNTAFLPRFYANSGYLSSTEKGFIEINYDHSLGLRSKLIDTQGVIDVYESEGKFVYEVNNVPALKSEPFSPGFQKIVSKALFSLDYFHLEGIDGEATSWKAFGKWMDTNLLAGTEEIPIETAKDIRELIEGIDNVSERVRLVYEYMQDRTRYISVQVGIGGWKPMLASDVDELGYGDCKALSNYTKALLDVAEIPSYYTILYGDSDKRDIQEDFPSVQGNHAILAVPVDDDYIWLECTSQTVPTGFIADFTDDRDVLVITPEGGQIVHTKKYSEEDNSQILKGSFSIGTDGTINATATMRSKGTQYDDRFNVERLPEEDQKKHYYKFWKYINNIVIDSLDLQNDKKNAVITESISFSADNYATFAGDEMLVTLNALNRFRQLPSKNKDRLYDIEIDRGFQDVDEVSIFIPEGMQVQTLPEDVNIVSDYGTYSLSIKEVNANEFLYNRSFTFFEGSYDKEQYADFRKFLRQVVRNDNQKIVVKKVN